MFCDNNCCKIIIEPYIQTNTSLNGTNSGFDKKAGVLIYKQVPNEEIKVLLVQSKGNFWGFPKGKIEENEKSRECALRELKEETGIILQSQDLKECICIHNKALYFIYNIQEELGSIQTDYEENDVNGITWMKLSCVKNMCKSSSFKLNYQCKYLLQKYFNLNVF